MDFLDVLQRRRMVRHFTDQSVSPNQVERLLAAAARAPSAGFTQGVSLVVVTEDEKRRELAVVAGESWYVAQRPGFTGATVTSVERPQETQ